MKIDFAEVKADDSIEGKQTQKAIEAIQTAVIEALMDLSAETSEGAFNDRVDLNLDPTDLPKADWPLAFLACAQLMKEGC